MKREAFSTHYRQQLAALRQMTEETFYYRDEEELRLRKSPASWNTLEIIKHLNLTHQHYLERAQTRRPFPRAVAPELDLSWRGRWACGQMQPKSDGRLRYKMPAPRANDPAQALKRGEALVPDVLFRDFIADLATMDTLLQEIPDYALEKVKIPTLIPVISLPLHDALAFMLAHLDRHLQQAQRLYT